MKLEITGFGAILLAFAVAADLVVNIARVLAWIIARLRA